MYPVALLLSAATTASTTGLPFFHLGGLNIGPLPIQWFGMIVAAGVLIGASLLRRYAEWHGVSDEQIRGLTGWVTVSGFLGAHWFDALFYEWHRLSEDPLLFFKIWDGISSYGGFLGGAIGFALYVWWKRLPARLMADITIVGLLPAFSIGRIGCTVVSDHIGAAVDASKWYAFLAMDYPRTFDVGPIKALVREHPGTGEFIKAWNLGLIEFLYLIPVNIVVLYLAFRSKKRPNAGFLVVLTGMLYAPVRFFLDYLRPESTDPRYLSFTFAQWSSILAFGVAVYAATRIMKNGKPAEPITATAREAQDRLKVVLKDDAKVGKDATKDAKDAKKAEDKPKAKRADSDAGADSAKPAPAKAKDADKKPPTDGDLTVKPTADDEPKKKLAPDDKKSDEKSDE